MREIVLAIRPEPGAITGGRALLTLADLPEPLSTEPSSLSARMLAACVTTSGTWIALGNLGYDPPTAALDRLAQRWGLGPMAPLLPPPARVTIAVYVPLEAIETVRQAIWKAGAGVIGAYDRCSFAQPGTGTYRPLEGANPYRGTAGREEQAEEWRLEFQCSPERLDRVLAAMLTAHPYEEVAYTVVPATGLPAKGRGIGRVGGGVALYAGDARGTLVARAARKGTRTLHARSFDETAQAAALDIGIELQLLVIDELESEAMAFLKERLSAELPGWVR